PNLSAATDAPPGSPFRHPEQRRRRTSVGTVRETDCRPGVTMVVRPTRAVLPGRDPRPVLPSVLERTRGVWSQMDDATNRPVLVGVDGSTSATEAVRWAANEAVRRRAPLVLVHVWTPVP